MSTTIPFSLVSNPQLLDVVDDQWMQDKLEDDDIALPEGVQAPSTDMDDPVTAQPQTKQPEKWGDLGLQSVH
ncbi:g750 [Coccomyxa viridis]|uniref:G750 protein n=1 Tax=Coccomyxa viridis TaxID=1274662 RepID=A0ABP1FGF4_9CHLO